VAISRALWLVTMQLLECSKLLLRGNKGVESGCYAVARVFYVITRMSLSGF